MQKIARHKRPNGGQTFCFSYRYGEHELALSARLHLAMVLRETSGGASFCERDVFKTAFKKMLKCQFEARRWYFVPTFVGGGGYAKNFAVSVLSPSLR